MSNQTKVQIAIDYLVLCGENQGEAYRAGRNAEMAIQITLEEDKRLNAYQLNPRAGGVQVTESIQRRAVDGVAASWKSWEDC